MAVKHFLYLLKLAAQMVTLTSSENLFTKQRYEFQNPNFDFETTKTMILHAWSIFFMGAHLPKLWSKKIFPMKTLLKLGALTVLLNLRTLVVTFVCPEHRCFLLPASRMNDMANIFGRQLARSRSSRRSLRWPPISGRPPTGTFRDAGTLTFWVSTLP
jgi:hypothetical protein